MRPRACSNATRIESNAGPARPLRLSVCLRIKIGLQWFIALYQASCRMRSPPSSLTSSPRLSSLGSCLSDYGASLYCSTSLRLIYPEYSASSVYSTSLRLKYPEYSAASVFFKTPTITSACTALRPVAPQQACGLRQPQESHRQRNWPGFPSRQSSSTSTVVTYSSTY